MSMRHDRTAEQIQAIDKRQRERAAIDAAVEKCGPAYPAEPTPAPVDMKLLMEKIRARGLAGLVIADQGGARPDRYLALCINWNGELCDPRNHHTQPSPEAALADLATRL